MRLPATHPRFPQEFSANSAFSRAKPPKDGTGPRLRTGSNPRAVTERQKLHRGRPLSRRIHLARQIFLFTCGFGLGMLLYMAFRIHRSARRAIAVDRHKASFSLFADSNPAVAAEDNDVTVRYSHTARLPPTSRDFTIVLPVHPRDLRSLRDRLFDILHLASSFGPRSQYEGDLREVLLVCPEDSLAPTKRVVQQALLHYEASNSRDHALEITVHGTSSRGQSAFPDFQLLYVASSMASAPWIYFDDMRPSPQMATFSDVHKPSGPRGFSIALHDRTLPPHCVSPSVIPTSVTYLVPPFVLPVSRLQEALEETNAVSDDIWQRLGGYFAKSDGDGVGGNLIGLDDGYCALSQQPLGGASEAGKIEDALTRDDRQIDTIMALPNQNGSPIVDDAPKPQSVAHGAIGQESAAPSDYLRTLERSFLIPPGQPQGTAFVVLHTVDDLRASSYLFCRLAREHRTRIAVLLTRYYESVDIASEGTCDLPFHVAADPGGGLRSWLETLRTGQHSPDIIFMAFDAALVEEPSLAWVQSQFPAAVVVRLPREDLQVSDWMGSLTVDEWKNWHKPEVEASIITRDRPQSLQRLFASLSEAYFYGDRLNIRINLEQDADVETFEVVQRFAASWPHGTVSVQHRVVRGGLLPAVVESWYPRTDDSHGLLLEDDVELSPLFYAWTKMALLRYRYGVPAPGAARLFGISLYQQKSNELHADGRRAFDARALFAAHPAVAHAGAPYLSQVPCSWGAVYFPDAWRAFHAYLALRLSGRLLAPGAAVAPPGLRSNAWARSWKKFFIELAYLDGRAMLYPNYAGFASLSTNHLERGSHVKVRSREKREMFQVPLMRAAGGARALLADMPGEGLPALGDLPVLDLTGGVTSLEEIAAVGRARREELHACWAEGDPGCEAQTRSVALATVGP